MYVVRFLTSQGGFLDFLHKVYCKNMNIRIFDPDGPKPYQKWIKEAREEVQKLRMVCGLVLAEYEPAASVDGPG